MRLLLDTHIWLWSVLEPERLSARMRGVLTRPDVEAWLSPISVWESLVLIDRGRLTVNGDPDVWIDDALRTGGFREAPLTHAVARATRRVDLPHRDPADRFLVATARVLDLTLATADQRLLAAKPCPLLPNS